MKGSSMSKKAGENPEMVDQFYSKTYPAAQNTVESVQHSQQQAHGAEAEEISAAIEWCVKNSSAISYPSAFLAGVEWQKLHHA